MQKNAALVLLIVTLGLISLGMVMLASTGARPSSSHPELAYNDLRKQFSYLLVGGLLCIGLSRFDYQRWIGYAPFGLGLGAFLLILCFIPGVQAIHNGSPRWIHLGGWEYQPSEFVKLALAVFFAWWLGIYNTNRTFLWSLLIPTLIAAPMLIMVAKEKDLGATAILLVIVVSIYFAANVPLIYLIPVPVMGVLWIAFLAVHDPVKFARVEVWAYHLMTPDADVHLATAPSPDDDDRPSPPTPVVRIGNLDAAMAEKTRNQVEQGLIALGSGGMFGVGLGDSVQKHGYLPESNTDFVFAIIGEELGLVTTLLVVFAFLLLCLSGTWIAVHAPDAPGTFLAVSLTAMITVQALMNLAVVTELMPCKGLPLPFISYGGSNLLTCLAAVGILFNIQRQGHYEPTRRRFRPRVNPTNVRM